MVSLTKLWDILQNSRGSHFLMFGHQGPMSKCALKKKVLVTQLWLWDLMDYSLPGSSLHEILQARILECVAIPFSRGSSQPRGWTWVSCIAGGFFTIWAISETFMKILISMMDWVLVFMFALFLSFNFFNICAFNWCFRSFF